MTLSVGDAQYGVRRSRRLIIETTRALGEHAGAVTVVGAHAVHVWVQDKWGDVEMETTRDGDLAINPVYVAPDPKIVEMMEGIGLERASEDRPGIYGYSAERDLDLAQRTTIDLLVPEAFAGSGRRSAELDGQKQAATRARGLELALFDRTLTTLHTFDEPNDVIEVHVAGQAALLIAKAHKIGERVADFDKRPDRLKPKDSGDVALLMMTISPEEASATMANGCATQPLIAEAVKHGAQQLLALYDMASDPLPRRQAALSLGGRFGEDEVYATIDEWIPAFRTAAQHHGLLETTRH